MENLCDHPVFTGYSVDGGYAEFAAVRADSPIHFPPVLIPSSRRRCSAPASLASAACASQVSSAESVSAFTVSAAPPRSPSRASIWDCEVYVVTRGESHRRAAAALGATWVGDEDAKPPIASSTARSRLRLGQGRRQRARSPAQRRRCRHQRHSSRPDAGLRLRSTALG